MPFVNVNLIEDVVTTEQKKQIVHDLTEAMVNIEGENMRPITRAVVEGPEFSALRDVVTIASSFAATTTWTYGSAVARPAAEYRSRATGAL